MNRKKKDGYLVASGFIVMGGIFLYATWWQFNLPFYLGLVLTGIGTAGFKWPQVAEILVHWSKKQEKTNANYSTKQIQKNTKNSNQANTNSGDIHIYQYKK